MTRVRAWQAFLLANVAMFGVYVSAQGAARDYLYLPFGIASTSVILVRAARLPYGRRLPWLLLALGQGAAVAGDLLWNWIDYVEHRDPFPSVADIAYLAEYPLLAASLLVVVRQRRSRRDSGNLADSSILSVGLGLLIWVSLIRPQFDGSGLTLERVVLSAYPLCDVVILALLSCLLTSRGRRVVSFRLLTSGMLGLLLGDTLFSVVGDESTGAYSGLVGNVPFLASYALWGSAALHPSAGQVSEPGDVIVEGMTRRRLVALTAASLLAPGVLGVELAIGSRLDGWALVLSSGLLFVLVVLRMAGLLRRLQEQSARLEAITRTDFLTGLPNRRSADAQLERAQDWALATDSQLSVALLDIDRFKAYNDGRGHQAGDRLLVGCAAAWTSLLGSDHLVARYGGEEFLLLAPGCSGEEVTLLLEELRQATPEGQSFSAGVAVWDGTEAASMLVHRADLALYAAKRAGRARTQSAPPAAAHAA